MKFFQLARMAISRVDVWYFITELVTRNPNLCIPALEDGLFANLLIFDYLYYIYVLIYSHTSFGGWTFCKFVDFRLSILYIYIYLDI